MLVMIAPRHLGCSWPCNQRRYLARLSCLPRSLPARLTSGRSRSEERADAPCLGMPLSVVAQSGKKEERCRDQPKERCRDFMVQGPAARPNSSPPRTRKPGRKSGSLPDPTKMTPKPEVRIWNFGNGTARAQVLPLAVPFAGPSMEAERVPFCLGCIRISIYVSVIRDMPVQPPVKCRVWIHAVSNTRAISIHLLAPPVSPLESPPHGDAGVCGATPVRGCRDHMSPKQHGHLRRHSSSKIVRLSGFGPMNGQGHQRLVVPVFDVRVSQLSLRLKHERLILTSTLPKPNILHPNRNLARLIPVFAHLPVRGGVQDEFWPHCAARKRYGELGPIKL